MSFVGTFGSFTTARLGIYAAQKGLSVTGNNISNINTKGYTRQALDQISLRTGGSDRYQSQFDARVGHGVLCTGVSQIRDPYLDIRYRNEMSAVGYSDAKLAGLEDLAAVLDEVAKGDDEFGVIEAQFSDFLKTLQNLSVNTELDGYDSQVRASASALVTLFRSYAKRLEDVEKNTVEDFKQDVETVNKLLTNIRDLNTSIRKSEIHGDSALELRDERNRLIDELSQYMKIDVIYGEEDIGGGQMIEKLTIKLPDVKDPKGNPVYLVDGIYGRQVDLTKVPQPNPNFDPADPNSFKYLKADGSGTNNRNLANQVLNPDYDLSMSELLDAKGLEPLGGSDELTATDLADAPFHGSIQAVRDMLTGKGEFSDTDADSNFRGIPYYRKSLDLLANQFATAFNEANQGFQINKDGNYVTSNGAEITIAGLPVSRTGLTAEQEAALANTGLTFDELMVQKGGVKIGGDLFSSLDGEPITAANICISEKWNNREVKIVNDFRQDAGSTANDNLLHMIAMMDAPRDFLPKDVTPGAISKIPMFKGSFQEMLGNINAVLGNDRRSTNIELNNYYNASVQLDTSRDAVSGVDLNDEAANMMQYQKSYAAACRMMTALDETLDKLINGTGIVGR